MSFQILKNKDVLVFREAHSSGNSSNDEDEVPKTSNRYFCRKENCVVFILVTDLIIEPFSNDSIYSIALNLFVRCGPRQLSERISIDVPNDEDTLRKLFDFGKNKPTRVTSQDVIIPFRMIESFKHEVSYHPTDLWSGIHVIKIRNLHPTQKLIVHLVSIEFNKTMEVNSTIETSTSSSTYDTVPIITVTSPSTLPPAESRLSRIAAERYDIKWISENRGVTISCGETFSFAARVHIRHASGAKVEAAGYPFKSLFPLRNGRVQMCTPYSIHYTYTSPVDTTDNSHSPEIPESRDTRHALSRIATGTLTWSITATETTTRLSVAPTPPSSESLPTSLDLPPRYFLAEVVGPPTATAMRPFRVDVTLRSPVPVLDSLPLLVLLLRPPLLDRAHTTLAPASPSRIGAAGKPLLVEKESGLRSSARHIGPVQQITQTAVASLR